MCGRTRAPPPPTRPLSRTRCARPISAAADDTRTPDQHRAAALIGLAHLVLDKGLVGGGGALVRPHISVHVSWETMQRLASGHGDAAADGHLGTGPAELDDGTPIPMSVLAR